MKSEKVTHMAMLTVVALTLYWLESMIPLPISIPGVKLGLSHIVTIFAVWILGVKAGGAVLFLRILLSTIFSGSAVRMLYAFSGGILAFVVTAGLRQVLKENQIWIIGCLSAIAHSLGQLIVGVWLLNTPSYLLYLPVLLPCSMIAGVFTGLCAQLLIKRGDHLWKTIFE